MESNDDCSVDKKDQSDNDGVFSCSARPVHNGVTTVKMGQITVLGLIYCPTETSEVTSSLSMSRRLLLYKFVNRSSTTVLVIGS